ncbi:MAG: metal-sensitive transcriptional regulator [Myxococcaceae bacterium]|nr:MAG: metal-sensitive transcriptional regulator [Myxococcaceae bacterium]
MAKTKAPPVRLVTIEAARKQDIQTRLARLRGQLDGIGRMVEEGRYCIDILNQVASVQESLRGLSRVVMRNYLESCATSALRSADSAEATRIYDEIIAQLYKHAR